VLIFLYGMLLWALHTYFCFHSIGTDIAKNAVTYIVEKRQVYGFCVDGRSLEPGKNVMFDAHRTLFEEQIFGIENLNLEKDVLQGNYQKSLSVYIQSYNTLLNKYHNLPYLQHISLCST